MTLFSHRRREKSPNLGFSRGNKLTCLNFGDCLGGVWKVFGNCLEGVWQVSGDCLKGVLRVSGAYLWVSERYVWLVV